jgi:hypothetical protein
MQQDMSDILAGGDSDGRIKRAYDRVGEWLATNPNRLPHIINNARALSEWKNEGVRRILTVGSPIRVVLAAWADEVERKA